jgi:drug/metabolite transporter (DMT)-like permease
LVNESSLPLQSNRYSAPALLLISMTLWVAVEIVGSIATRELSIPQLEWLRYVFHLLLMVIVLGPRQGLGFVRTTRPVLQIVRSLLMVVMPVSFMLGVRAMPASQVLGIFWIAPVLVVVFSRAIGERATSLTWIAVLAGWLAALGLNRPSLASLNWSVGYPLAMAASFALYIVLTRVLDRTEGVLTNMFYSAAGVALALTPVLPSFWLRPSATAVMASAAVAIGGYAVLWTLNLALRVWPAPRTAAFLFVQVLIMRFVEVTDSRQFSSKSLWAASALVVASLYIESRNREAQQRAMNPSGDAS